ncbi:uncharacterized protein LOC108050959 [Drosophila rhopaloa]|uniref:Uncharacterized protein LOC108050959 n=1 Tax=Drosophila rhopaloa TaxID=1041015 RepID=A0A6P4FTA0_DRORH|nr:uncharacterized protein LOC108050959 [Drosophila rhopaloa]
MRSTLKSRGKTRARAISHYHQQRTKRTPDIDMTSTCLPAIRATLPAPSFPFPSRKESRAPCVPSSLKPKSQSRRFEGIVAHGIFFQCGSSLLAHSHTDLISSLARHCVTLTGNHRSNHHHWIGNRNSTTQASSRCMCIVRKFAGGIPTSIGIVPHSCSRLLGLGQL